MQFPGHSEDDGNEEPGQLAAKATPAPPLLPPRKHQNNKTHIKPPSKKKKIGESAQKTFLKSTHYAGPLWPPCNQRK